MSGHVFVVHGDLTALSCDAWLLPGGAEGLPGPTWWPSVGTAPLEPIPQDFGRSHRRVVAWRPLREGAPQPYLTDLGGSRGTAIEWYLDGAREFFERAARDLRGLTPRNGRARPLIALPLVGTGMGGKHREAGAVARQLMPVLYEAAAETDLDIALVMKEGPAYSAIQAERTASFGDRAFEGLDPELDETGRRLANRAARGQMVLFVGAGVSSAAGLPAWRGLLDALGVRAGMSPEDRRALAGLNPLDQARFIEERLGGTDIGGVVADLLESIGTHYALSHGLLAALPIDQVVTTNYDRLFEAASSAASRPVTILPYDRVKEPSRRWLLKMHGCVSRPEDIVLTRDDYLAYRERREALAAIVQALLITRHMLFVGFGLEDDNFHQIVHSVRKAVAPGSSFGTSLMVETHPLAASLWAKDIRFVSVDRGGRSRSEASRMLEILLDRMGAGSVSATQHLFDPRYDGVLTPGERRIAGALSAMVAGADDEMRDSVAWSEVEAMLLRLGWKDRR